MLKQLYPSGIGELPLKGLYLKLHLHQCARNGEVLIYANYISSLDGRISLFDEQSGEFSVPDSIANKRDWRLYQELAGQCDVMLTSARYFRQLAQGKAQDLLPVGTSPDYEDIRIWREEQGLKPQPDVMVISDSLDIPQQALAKLGDRKVTVLTKKQGETEKVKTLEMQGVQVIQGKQTVSGSFIRQTLRGMGYRSAYMIAGPKVHHTLAAEGCVDELFLTSHMSLLGGSPFHSVLEDSKLAINMKLITLYLDEVGNQLLMRYQYAA